MRWFHSAAINENAIKNNIRTILISHGSHPHQDNTIINYEFKEHVQGLLFSELATDIIAQSP